MDHIFQIMPVETWVYAALIGLFAGLVKGVTGFALPMILISGLGSFLPPEMALAGLIIPTLVSNWWQALRQGIGAAWGDMIEFKAFLLAGGVVLLAASQLVVILPGHLILLGLGVALVAFGISQLMGRKITLRDYPSLRLQVAIGAVAGFFGGISGVWGPPTVALLTAMETPKAKQMRVQGVIYGLGAVLLTLGHIVSGVLNRESAGFSALMLLPVGLGMIAGLAVHDRIDLKTFQKLTLIVLTVAGANLVRRGILGL